MGNVIGAESTNGSATPTENKQNSIPNTPAGVIASSYDNPSIAQPSAPHSMLNSPEYAAAAAYQRHLQEYRHGMHAHYEELCQQLKETRERAQRHLELSWWYYPLPIDTPPVDSSSSPSASSSSVSLPMRDQMRSRLRTRSAWWSHKTLIAASVEMEMVKRKREKVKNSQKSASNKAEKGEGGPAHHSGSMIEGSSRDNNNSNTNNNNNETSTMESSALMDHRHQAMMGTSRPAALSLSSSAAAVSSDVSTAYFSPASAVVSAISATSKSHAAATAVPVGGAGAAPAMGAPALGVRSGPRLPPISAFAAYRWWLRRFLWGPLGVGVLYLHEVVTPDVRAQALHEALHDRAVDELQLTVRLYP